EHRSLARERYDVPLEERDDLLKEHLSSRDATRNTSTWGFPGFGVIEPFPKTSRASSRSGRPLSCWYRKNSGLAMKPNRLGCFLMLTASDPSPSMNPARNHLALSSHESLSC